MNILGRVIAFIKRLFRSSGGDRSVSIGGSANKATIVTGDRNHIGGVHIEAGRDAKVAGRDQFNIEMAGPDDARSERD